MVEVIHHDGPHDADARHRHDLVAAHQRCPLLHGAGIAGAGDDIPGAKQALVENLKDIGAALAFTAGAVAEVITVGEYHLCDFTIDLSHMHGQTAERHGFRMRLPSQFVLGDAFQYTPRYG